jgi:biotin carboxyl carrier protein
MADKSYTPSGGSGFQVRRGAGGALEVKREGEKSGTSVEVRASSSSIDSQTVRLQTEGPLGRRLLWTYSRGNQRVLSWPGGSVELEAAEINDAAGGAGGSLKPLKLTMPGKVLSVKVAEGDVVEAGHGLVIVEAMKMENLLLAPGRARIAKVHVKAGDRLESGTILITFAEA